MLSSLRSGPGAGVLVRDRPQGRIVYPVVSRRSGGLSLGIDLFPDAKDCSFDCPYCEVFLPPKAKGPAPSGAGSFSLTRLEAELKEFSEASYRLDWAPDPVRDLCFSGSGEPTSSPFLSGALAACSRARRAYPEVLGGASLVLITNSTGFLDPAISELLIRSAREESLDVWAKLDGGTEDLFRLMSGTEGRLEEIAGGILSFARQVPIVIQTMLCEVEGRRPSAEELEAYCDLVARLRDGGALIRELHLYTFARPTPAHACAPLGDGTLAHWAARIGARTGLRVRAFGRASELPAPDGPNPDPASSGSPKPAGLRRINPEGIDQ